MAKPTQDNFLCNLTPHTTHVLCDILGSYQTRCQIAAEEGFPSLLKEYEVIAPFHEALAKHLNTIRY